MKTTSLNELAFELWELRRAYIKDTDPMDIRLLVDWIQSMRAMLLKQKFDQPFAAIDDHYVQDLGTVSMVKELSNSIVPVINNYDYMWRTSIEIPRTIENKEGLGTFARIGPADKLTTQFQITTHRKAVALGYGKFNYNTIYAFVLGNYIYLTSKGGLHFTVKYLNIRGVFQNPITAARISDPTWDYNDDYPINKEIVDQLKTLIIQSKFALTLVQASDKVDNLEDNPEGNTNIPKGQTQQNNG